MTLPIIIIAICLIGSAAFSGFENGILAVRRARLDHALVNGSWTAKLIDRFLQNPGAMLATILLGNNICNIYAATYYEVILKQLFGSAIASNPRVETIVSFTAAGLMTIFVLICGEITPKVWFRQRPLHRVSLLVGPIFLFYKLTLPLVMLLTMVSNLMNRLTGAGKVKATDISLMREDFRMMILESEEAGQLDHEARLLLDNALEHHERRVRNLMIPKEDVVSLYQATTLAEALVISDETGRSRFPVADESGNWIGVFSIYDAIYTHPDPSHADEGIIQAIRPAVTIHAAASVDQILRRSKPNQSPLLIVVDKGEQVGIVTTKNVVYPLFGNLDD